MSSSPSLSSSGAKPAAPVRGGTVRAGEASVAVAAIAAVTVLTVLQRPVPMVLTVLAAAAGFLLLPGGALRLLGGTARLLGALGDSRP
ncbi:hypothetical protein [Streptomyces sp. NPDC094049]|uniref:hypothetical protein n=1 Tax=Streptomyces sp. NPDC094049 TaxID=3154987 RepID=UPI0033205C6D